MSLRLRPIIRHASLFARHFLTAGNEHGIHSPFVYKLLTEGVYVKKPEPEFNLIEEERKRLLSDIREIDVLDLGAGSSFDGKLTRRSVADIAAKFAKSPRCGKFLFRLTRHLRPRTMIELGTSLGISAMYQSAGNPDGTLYTLEGCPETARLAREQFQKCGYDRITCLTGNFDQSLPGLLKGLKEVDYMYVDGNHTRDATLRYFDMLKPYRNNQTIILFDDIYWSDGMREAWKRIQLDPAVTISIDFFQFGLVSFNPGFTKQHFRLRSGC